jgi:cupin fold WbuC family metalloprotein
MIKINKELVSCISEKAKGAPRKRLNYNFHAEPSDPVNRMLNAVEPEAYFPPHKHNDPSKREVFIILRGRVVVLEFDDTGVITDHVVLDAKKGNFGVEIPPGTWHSLAPLESGSVLYEMKDGPYIASEDKLFADWAPEENDPAAAEYVKDMLAQIGL